MTNRIVFIDAQVADYQTLIAGLPAGTEYVVLSSNRDGVTQIAEALQGRTNLDAIDIISHGAPGALFLDNSVLNSHTLTDYFEQLASIGRALSVDGDLLLYGCSVAADNEGQAFIQRLAQVTGANVAASTNLTGAASQGGDWLLESHVGHIKTVPIVQESYAYTLAAGSLDLSFSGDGIAPINIPGDGNSVVMQGNNIIVAGSARLARYTALGDLDTNFGGTATTTGTGVIATTIGNISSVILQGDKIVVAGTSNGNFALARYTSFGELDTSFGNSGTMTTDFGGNAYSIALQNDKILVAGSNGNDFTLARYDQDGHADNSFGDGGNGKVVTDLGANDIARNVTVLPDGRIILSGTTNGDFALASYDSEGHFLNQSITDFGGNDIAYSAALQGNKLIVAGQSTNGSDGDFALARYDFDGNIDTSFGLDDTGKVTSNFSVGDAILSVAIQADNSIIVAGSVANGGAANFALASYTNNGVLDFNFNDSNYLASIQALGFSYASDIAIDSNGRIVATGTTLHSIGETYASNFAVVRLNGNYTPPVNQAPTNVELTNKIASLSENTPTTNHIKVADIVITDDGLGSNTITLEGTDKDNFEVIDNTLYLKGGTTLIDGTQFNVTVQVQDPTITNNPALTYDYSLSINPQNNPPNGIGLIGDSINENIIVGNGIKVGDLEVYDPDTSGNNNILSLALGLSADNFEIRNNSELWFNGASPNFESLPYYDITVIATDGALFTPVEQPIRVTVNDVNEAPDSFITANEIFTLNENTNTSSPIKVADISVHDDALGINTFTLTGNDKDSFTLENGALYLKAGTLLSNSNHPVYDVSVNVQDTTIAGSMPLIFDYRLTINPSNNQRPILANENTPLAYTENDQATAINTVLTVTDVDNTTLVSGKVTIVDGFFSGQDVLYFANDGSTMGNIAATFDDVNGVLNLTSAGGTATLQEWQTALRAVKYANTRDNPNTAEWRFITYEVNDGQASSLLLDSQVRVTASNDAPVGGVTLNNATSNTRGTTAAQVGDVLNANNNITDEDNGATPLSVTYHWLRNGVDTTATGASYTLTAADAGKTLSAKASYTDLGGTAENVTSAPTNSINNIIVNQPPVLEAPPVPVVTITDTAAIDTFQPITTYTLSATDPDGTTPSYGISGVTVNAGVSTLIGTYGTLTVTAASGAYTFTPDNAAINALNTGQNPTQTFSVIATDGLLSDTKPLTINLIGANESTPGTISGTSGSDTLNGTTGNDVFMGSAGADVLNGGAGVDTADYSTSPAGVKVNLQAGTASGGDAQGDTFNSIENLTGSNLADTLTGNLGNNVLNGGGGNDTLVGGAGRDTLNLGAGQNEHIVYQGLLDAGDTITGFKINAQDSIDFSGVVKQLFDNGSSTSTLAWGLSNASNNSNTAVNLNNIEALYLGGNANDGISTANVTSASAVAAEFNAEFAISGAGLAQTTLLVVNDNNSGSNKAAIWVYTESVLLGAEIQPAELLLVGTVEADSTLLTSSLNFV